MDAKEVGFGENLSNFCLKSFENEFSLCRYNMKAHFTESVVRLQIGVMTIGILARIN